MQDLESIQSKRLQRKLDRQKALPDNISSPPPKPAPEPSRPIKRVASNNISLQNLANDSDHISMNIKPQIINNNIHLSVDKPEVELPRQHVKIIQKIVPESELLALIKPKIPQQISYKQFKRQFNLVLQQDKVYHSQRINAINQIITQTTQKFKESIQIIINRIVELKSSNLQVNIKMIKQRENQLVLTIIKSNLKIQKLKKKLINALHISNIEVFYANTFLLLKHIYNLNQIKSIQNKQIIGIFTKWKQTAYENQEKSLIADALFVQKRQKFLFNFLQTTYNEICLQIVVDDLFEFNCQRKYLSLMQTKIEKKVFLRSKLIGSTIQHAQLSKIVESKNTYCEQIKQEVTLYQDNFIHFQSRIFQFLIPNQRKFNFQQMIKTGTFTQQLLGSMVQSRISIFKLPDVKIVQKTNQIENKIMNFNIRFYQQRILQTQNMIKRSNKLLYLNKNNGQQSILQINNISFLIQNQLESLQPQEIVKVYSNLYSVAKCFQNWYLQHIKQEFYIKIQSHYQQRNLTIRYLHNWIQFKKINDCKEQNIINQFQKQTIMYKFFQRLRIVNKSLLTDFQKQKADRFFKLIVMRRQLQQWSQLCKNTRKRETNFKLFISILQEITLIKPYYLKWNVLANMFSDARNKGIILTTNHATDIIKTTFTAMLAESNKRKLLRRVFQKAVHLWWEDDFYQQSQLPHDILQTWKQLPNHENSVKIVTSQYNLKLKFKIFQELKKSFYENAVVNSYQEDNYNKIISLAFKAIQNKAKLFKILSHKVKIVRQFNFASLAYNAWKQQTIIEQRILNPILKHKILKGWQNHVKLVQILHLKQQRFLVVHAFKKIVFGYNLALKEDIFVQKYSNFLQTVAFSLLREMSKQKQQQKQQTQLNLLETADSYYLQKLRLYIKGENNLCSDQRLMQGKKFVYSFQTLENPLKIQEELQDYVKVYKIQIQLRAFISWMNKLK